MEVTSFTQLLDWLAGAGGAVLLAAWALSWALEGWPAWERLAPNHKSALILALAAALTLAAVGVQSLPAAALARLAPYGDALVLCVAAWLSTQVAHRANTFRK